MRICIPVILVLFFAGCYSAVYHDFDRYQRVWGNKPVYGIDSNLKKITIAFSSSPLAVLNAGNIYVKDNYLYQVEIGKGIHIIDNTVPANASRIGFITINGCSQISIKGDILYSNNYDDLVMINIGDIQNLKEVARTKNAFPSGRYHYPPVSPRDAGYYQCPGTDSLVIGWVKDSILSSCYK